MRPTRRSRSAVATLVAGAGALLVAMGLSACGRVDASDGPKPGELRTTDGNPAPPEAASVKGTAPPSSMPPPGQMLKGRGRR